MTKVFLILLSILAMALYPEGKDLKGMWYACEQEECVADSAVALYHFTDTTVSLYLKMPDGLDPLKIYEGRYFIERDSFCTINEKNDTSKAGVFFLNDSTVHMFMGPNEKTTLKRI